MRKLVVLITLSLLVSGQAFAKEFRGSRVGIGYGFTMGDYDNWNDIWYDGKSGGGLALTYGYDFNRVVGLNINYQGNKGTEDKSELSGTSSSFDLDIGWAMDFDSWYLKPYGAIGYGKHLQDVKQYKGHSCSYGVCSDIFHEDSFNEGGILIGVGFRAQLNNDVFFELRDDSIVGSDIISGRTALLVGFRF